MTEGDESPDGSTGPRPDGGTAENVPVAPLDQGPATGAGHREGPAEDEVEPVEVLVQLAKDDEIEPWDIDIVAVTDKFLDRLDASDLRTGGRALFYASVLLRMKSEALLEPADDEPPADEAMRPLEPGQFPPGDPARAADPFDALEAEIDRRIDRKPVRGTPRTLDDLVRELRERERWWKQSRTYETDDGRARYARGTQSLEYRGADDVRIGGEPTEQEVTGDTHREDIEAVIEAVRRRLEEQYGKGRREVLFEEVVDAGSGRVEVFLAVLFLAHRGLVQLRQDELFGDLWIQDPTVAADGEEAMSTH